MTAHVLVKDQFVLNGVLARQRTAFNEDGPPSLKQRRADLARLKSAVLLRRTAIEAAISADFGNRSAYETRIMELVPLVQTINYLRRNLGRWMRPEKRQIALHFIPASSYVLYQPLGVVGIISPWNYPLSLALMPLATAVAAGNRVMLKPSEHTPATTALMKEMLRELFPEDQVAVIPGGADTGAAFASLPFDHLVFTGSTAVGRSVMKSAADNLVPTTLELGGKSPAILARDADAKRAALSIAYGKLANAGQTCIAPDYVLVQHEQAAAFAEHYRAAVAALYPEGAASRNYTSMINDKSEKRLHHLLNDARKKGAQVIPLGPEPSAGRAAARKTSPVLVLGATMDMAVMKDEIFGPVLPILTFDDIDEAIKLVNRLDRPLALYYFGANGEDRRKVLTHTTTGNVTINDTLMHYVQNDLPFGGVGASGLGAYHGPEGFKNMSHAKGVFEQSRWNLGGFLRPPFRRVTDMAIRYLLW